MLLIFISISISNFRRQIVFILSFSCGNHAVFSVSMVTRTAYHLYLVRARISLFVLSEVCDVVQLSCCVVVRFYFCLLPWYSSTPELLEPVLRPRTALCCDHELMYLKKILI